MSEKQTWTSGPQTRGSFDILWSCLATLALCAWTAVHPNILRVPSSRRFLFSRLAMMVVAVVFPEFIISAAWGQLRASQQLQKQLNNLHESSLQEQKGRTENRRRVEDQRQRLLPQPLESEDLSENVSLEYMNSNDPAITSERDDATASAQETTGDDEQVEKCTEWTLKQAFFAVMGGFAIETEYIDAVTNKKIVLRRLVTVEGVLQLPKSGLIPPLTSDDVEERSKADTIAKMFVLSQITWFGLQVIGRLASQLPVSPLEVHTAIHVLCAIVMYVMWLEKPYDVRSSILLSSDDAKDMAALFHFYKTTASVYAQEYTQYQESRAHYWKGRLVHAANNVLDHKPPPNPPIREALTTAVEKYRITVTNDTDPTTTRSAQVELLVNIAPAAYRSIQRLKSRHGVTDATINLQDWDYLRESSENFTIRAVWGGWSTDTGHDMSLDKAVYFLFNLLYGCGHLSAWNSSSFPTSTEHDIWCAAAIMLALVPLWGCLWIGWWRAARSKKILLYLFRSGDLDIVGAPFFFVIILAYIASRSYFLIESLISLRLLPSEAFLVVNWTKFLPHIG